MSYISGAHCAKSKRCYNVKPSAYYFYVKAKIYVDFQIWISVLLRNVLNIKPAFYFTK